MFRGALAAGLVVMAGCGGTGGAGTGTAPTCAPSQAGCLQWSHTYSTTTIAAGQEMSDLCQSYTLNNPDEIWVSAVELDNDGAYHHSNWFFVPNTDFVLPDGTWSCSANMFDEVNAAIAGGVLYAQSTQAKHEVQQFPPGVAVRIPPWSRVVASTHLLNTASTSVTTTLRMTVTAVPKASVDVKLTPFRLTYHDLHIPPQASAQFSGSCDLSSAAANLMSPFSLKLYYVLPHYHKLGVGFSVAHLGGPSDGQVIDTLQGFDSEAHGKAFDPPVDVSADKGLQFSCTYTNPTTLPVGWGIGTQEMCEMLGFADSSLAYVAQVADGTGMATGTTGSTVQNTGPCSAAAVPWAQDKPGGTPPPGM